MLSESGLKTVSCLEKNKVQLVQANIFLLTFLCNGTEVTYDLRKGYWSCLCRHEAYTGPKTTTVCYHIRSSKLWLKNHRENWPALRELTEGIEL
jgi:hypothetical protein